MALEGLAALGVASNIAQFVDFGCRLFFETKELYNSSSNLASEAVELENISQTLGRLSKNLVVKHSLGNLPSSSLDVDGTPRSMPGSACATSSDERDLMLVAHECQKVAEELSVALNQLKVKDFGKKWQCFRVSLKRLWKPEKVDEIAKRMDRFSSQLTMCLVKILSTKQSEVLSSISTFSKASESDFESVRRTTLIILGELNYAHRMHTRSVRDREDQDRKISLQLGQLSSTLQKLSGTGGLSARESRFIESLPYNRMRARQENIIDAHVQTYEWILDPHESSRVLASKDSFLEWLSYGNGIFWITGKAGSGKSTLMKFLSLHMSTTQALERWADGKELITADYFFWHAGTELQKSQEGLLRSLLHGVLSQCPELRFQVYPKQQEPREIDHVKSDLWTRAELLSAFATLSRQTTLKKRFCFFIDGLDEYDGDHAEIVDLVQGLVQSNHIKICLSSRPWNEFTRAFGLGSHPTIRLEDLTRQDIQSYVEDTLSGNKLYCQLMAGKDSARCENLQIEIVSRAQGVFLWVFLVVRSLVQGLTNADRITDLERRLRSLPTDLEPYFRHMLGTIEDVYKQQTVQTFHIALQAAEPLKLMTYIMLDNIEENPEYAIELLAQRMTREDINSRCQDMKLRINARCKDLLQVTGKALHKKSSDGELFFQYEVEFLHRTVKDFFLMNDIQPLIAGRLPKNFDSSSLLCHAFLAQIKVAPFETQSNDRVPELWGLIDDLMHYAHEVEAQMAHPNIVLLDALSEAIKLRYDYRQIQAPKSFAIPDLLETVSTDTSISKSCPSILSFAVQRDLQLYVTCKLDEHIHHDLSWKSDMLVFDALQPSVCSKYDSDSQSPNRKMLRLLVDKGVVDLNKIPTVQPLSLLGSRVKGEKIWDHVVRRIRPCWARAEEDYKIQQLGIMDALLELGAESCYTIYQDVFRWVRFLLIPCENWNQHSSEFHAALTKVIVRLCERGIDPYWRFEEVSLWAHFLRSIYDDGGRSDGLRSATKKYVLVIVKKFLNLGAQLNDVFFDCESYRHQLSATHILATIFSPKEMEELESLQRRVEAESLKARISSCGVGKNLPSRAQRRKEKKKRKQRKRGRDP